MRLPTSTADRHPIRGRNNAQTATDLISTFACGLSGSVVQFTPDRLLQLYPTHDDYVQKYTQAADKAVAAGFMLQSDRDIAVDKAKNAPNPEVTARAARDPVLARCGGARAAFD